jgi:hypothetical protein
MHADRTNRVMLLLLALLLLAAGLDAGAASLGLFGHFTQHSKLTVNPTSRYFAAQGAWLWPVIAVAAGIMTLLALRWLVALLFSTDRAHDLPIGTGGPAGRTTLAGGALTEAVTEEIESYRGVDSARARLVGDSYHPGLVVTTTLEETADLVALRQRIENEALTHARSALDSPTMPVRLNLTVTTRRASRVD